MQRSFILLFGVIAYGLFLLTFLYLIAFVGNLQLTRLAETFPLLAALVPHSIDAGRPTGSLITAMVINLVLILLFGMQHSFMARIGFKAWLKHYLPASAERSVFVLIASLVLILLFWQWRPIAVPAWTAQSPWGQALGWSVFTAGFGLVLISTFLINHFELFGLKQVWSQMRRIESHPPQFAMPLFYRVVRHPLYLGFLLAFWGAPVMTAGHLLFAIAMSGYILVAIHFEERDLVRFHGQLYEHYRTRVPKIVPFTGWLLHRRNMH
ncbi:MAG: isoprenylcysteine carboxylmethyltransferase family protein [Gammaproteobacteria bacterium]|nr:isoprenylcysteine carboxylmethyltransferase family protein [Gammaproteobacteria bacterium]